MLNGWIAIEFIFSKIKNFWSVMMNTVTPIPLAGGQYLSWGQFMLGSVLISIITYFFMKLVGLDDDDTKGRGKNRC